MKNLTNHSSNAEVLQIANNLPDRLTFQIGRPADVLDDLCHCDWQCDLRGKRTFLERFSRLFWRIFSSWRSPRFQIEEALRKSRLQTKESTWPPRLHPIWHHCNGSARELEEPWREKKPQLNKLIAVEWGRKTRLFMSGITPENAMLCSLSHTKYEKMKRRKKTFQLIFSCSSVKKSKTISYQTLFGREKY